MPKPKNLARAMPIVHNTYCEGTHIHFGCSKVSIASTVEVSNNLNILKAAEQQLRVAAVQVQFGTNIYFFHVASPSANTHVPNQHEMLLLGQLLYVLERHAYGVTCAIRRYFSSIHGLRCLTVEQKNAAEDL